MSRSERPNWPPENLTHLHQVLKIKTPSAEGLQELAGISLVSAFRRVVRAPLGGKLWGNVPRAIIARPDLFHGFRTSRKLNVLV